MEQRGTGGAVVQLTGNRQALIDGCDGIVLGCTELSAVGCAPIVAGAAVVDALDVLAWRCVRECGAPARDLRARFADAACVRQSASDAVG